MNLFYMLGAIFYW